MDNLLGVIPHIPTKELETTVDFMSKVLGFKPLHSGQEEMEFYREISSENHILGILKSEGEPNEQSIYLHVSDADNVWNNIKSKLQKIDAKPPFNQEYGMREIHIIIPETNTLLMIGSQLP